METKFCYGCMRMKQQSPVCELCGFDERELNEKNQLPIGTVLQGQYVLGRVLGQGGFGITYIGWDRLLQIPVAVKEYFPSSIVHRDIRYGPEVNCSPRDQESFEKHRSRFLQEARTLAQLSVVPEIVQIKNFFLANQTAYIVMEYVQGTTLKDHMKKLGRPLSVEEAMNIMDPVLRGLQKVHELQLIHRDISPDNVMLLQDGSIKLIDFGTAKNMDAAMRSKSTESILKPGFAPLEQYNTKGNLGTWTDVYAICATFHYLLTGKLPPDAPTRIEEGEQLPLLEQVPGIKKPVLQTLQKGLAIRAADRIQSLDQLQTKLHAGDKKPAVKAQEKTREKKPAVKKEKKPTPEKEHTPKKKNKWLLPVLAAMLLLAVGALLFMRQKPSEEGSHNIQVWQTAPAAQAPEAIHRNPGAQISEPVELTLLACRYNDGTDQWWADFAAEFTEAYPNVSLVVDVVDWRDIYTVSKTRIVNGQGPDILNIDTFRDHQNDGRLLPVKDYLSAEVYGDIYPQMLAFSEAEGESWAVPDLCTARALYCNMDILEPLGIDKIPTTWVEVQVACEAIKASGLNVYPWGMHMTTDDGHDTFFCYALNNGGGFVDAEGNWNLNREENALAVDFAKNMVGRGLTNSDPATQTRWDLQDMFIAGEVAMMIAPNGLSSAISRENPDMTFEIAPIPVNREQEPVSVVAMDWLMVFDNGYSEAELQAITCFFDFFYREATHVGWVSDGYLPVTRSGARYLGEQDPVQAAWSRILENVAIYPADKENWVDVKIGIIDLQQQALYGVDTRSMLRQLQEEVTG